MSNFPEFNQLTFKKSIAFHFRKPVITEKVNAGFDERRRRRGIHQRKIYPNYTLILNN
jgi:hypothetical protein